MYLGHTPRIAAISNYWCPVKNGDSFWSFLFFVQPSYSMYMHQNPIEDRLERKNGLFAKRNPLDG